MKMKLVLLAVAIALTGCNDNAQSMLIPAGLEARQIATFSWVLFLFGAIVFLIVVGAMAAAIFGPRAVRSRLASRRTIMGLGLVFPAVTLLTLFVVSTLSTSRLLAVTSDPQQPPIRVNGEQWWWRIGYTTADGRTFESANEIHIPVGRPVVFELSSADVIHSFWIPALGGKIDMVPGRTTRLRLTAERAGVYRGQCAEYCGGPHALMAFTVIASEPAAHQAWLDRQGRPAKTPAGDDERNGAALFTAAGCGACHTIEGTAARGTIGPNLTGIGSRQSVGVDQNRLSHDSIVHFVTDGQAIKPHNRMPEFRFLRPHERDAIASYLLSLK
jgi:cytochrome c oxidase subunit II